MKIYIVTVKWVAEVAPMQLHERETFYFKSYSECRDFVELCRNDGHQVSVAQDACLCADQAYGTLLNKIEAVYASV